MKKAFTFIFMFGLCAHSAFSADMEKSRLSDETFVVETSDTDATDSLNRVSGKIESHFAPEENTYKAVHHGRSGPFSMNEEAYDVTS